MEELTLTTPSILFSAISLIMLAYTNRFLAYAQVIRNLKAEHRNNPTPITQLQMDNLRKRLYMTRSMQIFGISSLLLCVVCTFLIYIGMQTAAVYTFGTALVLLVVSLGISIRELQISVRALEVHLDHVEEDAEGKPGPASGGNRQNETKRRTTRRRSRGNTENPQTVSPAPDKAPSNGKPHNRPKRTPRPE